MKNLLVTLLCALPLVANAAEGVQGDFLIKMKAGRGTVLLNQLKNLWGGTGKLESLDSQWVHFQANPIKALELNTQDFLAELRADPGVEYAQLNYKIKLLENEGPQNFEATAVAKDPEIPSANVVAVVGADPLVDKQWGMKSIHADEAWKKFSGDKKMVVAVIDTGVDYTHEDLVGNMWHNPKEIPGNGIDDDGNGFIDDVVGWDFVQNDNKPYDIKGTMGGNPGHGTHCAGNVGAAGNNSKGISGVSPNVSIMAVRFLSEKGEGTTADGIKAINYAVNNGAKVLSNSWGSEGESPGEPNQALKDAITNAMNHDVLFIAAAGNGHNGKGYNNDTDPKPGVPASYDMDNIISVAALDVNNKLASFSNWGKKTVDVGAPGVKIYSTIVGGKYSDTVSAGTPWSGTSMATPHVAGAAALVWAAHPEYKWSDVKNALLSTVDKLPSLDGKTVSGGKINVAAAIQ